MSNKKLTQKIKRILFEDTYNAYGSEYMSHPYEQEDFQKTIQDELPIAASPTADMQLTDEVPPVDDETYEPENNKELARALHELGLRVPDDSAAALYKGVRNAVFELVESGGEGFEEEQEEATQLVNDEIEDSETQQSDVSERLNRLAKALIGESWDDFKLGSHYGDAEEEEEIENYKAPELSGKQIASYYGDKPKRNNPSQTAMITGSGRLLQNVVRPLLEVPDEQLSDAAEYLRLQYRVLTQGQPDVPREGPRTFAGLYIKKLVPKLKPDQLGSNFLQTVVQDYKRRNDKWLMDLAQKASAESASERQAMSKLKTRLKAEDPALLDVLEDLGIS